MHEKLSVVYMNADNLLNKKAELKSLIVDHPPDIICVVETLPKNFHMPIQAAELAIQGYDMFSNLSSAKRGVLILTRKKLKASPSRDALEVGTMGQECA